MTINRKLRDEAATMCAIMASDRARMFRVKPGPAWDGDAIAYLDLVLSFGHAGHLAEAAFLCTPDGWPLHEQWAEAEALLRMGWSPP